MKDERQSSNMPTYIVKPHSSAPYAWDSPAALDKKLMLKIGEAVRIVDVMEIGDLVPFRFRVHAS